VKSPVNRYASSVVLKKMVLQANNFTLDDELLYSDESDGGNLKVIFSNTSPSNDDKTPANTVEQYL